MPLHKLTEFSSDVVGGKAYEIRVFGPTRPDLVAIAAWHAHEAGNVPALKMVYLAAAEEGWREVHTAPENAIRVTVTLYHFETEPPDSNTYQCTITATEPAPVRTRVLASAYMRVSKDADWTTNRQVMIGLIETARQENVDLLCLSENFLERQPSGEGGEHSFSLPSPELQPIFDAVASAGIHVVFSFREWTDQGKLFNTAVLVGPAGNILGTYRKTHLTLHEARNGFSRGEEFPVFQTDLGKIGILICWDGWFPEAALALSRAGAEIVCFPVAGCGVEAQWTHAWPTRAMDNQVYWLASVTENCGGNAPSMICDPTGRIVATTNKSNTLAVAEVTLPLVNEVFWLSVGPSNAEWRNIIVHSRRQPELK